MPEEQPANGTSAAQASQEPAKGGASPPPVPYATFKETNDRVKVLEGEVSQAEKARTDAVTAAVAQAQAKFQTKLTLAKAGVHSDAGLDYLTDRYHTAPEKDRGAIGDWVTKLRSEEPAFFGGVPSATTPTPPTTTTSPKTNPDANSNPPPITTSDPPLSEQIVRDMDMKTYARRRTEILEWEQKRRRR